MLECLIRERERVLMEGLVKNRWKYKMQSYEIPYAPDR